MSARGMLYLSLRTRAAMLALIIVGLFIALISSSAGGPLRAAGIVTVGPRLTGMSDIDSRAFGYTVAIDGDTAAVSSQNTLKTVRIFKRAAADPKSWEPVKDFIGTDSNLGSGFGSSLAIDGDTLVVGAPYHNSDIGAAYIFQRNAGGPGAWGQVAKLSPSNGTMQTRFGDDVDIDGDTIIVSGTRINNVRGAVYIFRYNAATASWPEVGILSLADAVPNTFFGHAIAISGDTIVASAPWEDDEPNPTDGRGAVYVFQRNAGGPENWGQVAKIVRPTYLDHETFGQGVDISGDSIAIGSLVDDREALIGSGIYIYERASEAEEVWVHGPRLVPNEQNSSYGIGYAVELNGDLLVISKPYSLEHENGAAYIFQRDGTNPANWAQIAKVSAFDSTSQDFFSFALGFDGRTLIVGAPGARPSEDTQGASYIFSVEPAPDPTATPTETEMPSATATATAIAVPTAIPTSTTTSTATATTIATVTPVATATATASTTATAIATATTTVTATPIATATTTATATAAATAAPTATAIPSPVATEPELSTSGGNRGGPGSEFVLAAEGFAANQLVTISVDEQNLTTISADGSGKLNFVLWFGPGTPAGSYRIAVTSATPALAAARQIETLLTIDPNAPVLSAPANSGLPRISARQLVYLPLLVN